MDSRFHDLPPLKRFKLLQQEQEEEIMNSLQLPAKKRKESWDSPLLPTTTTQFLPAKKRVWALQPILNPITPLSPFDLNVEYKPSPEENEPEKETPDANEAIQYSEDCKEDEEDDDGIVCNICQSTDGDPSDPIVLCDGCDLMVHTTCYGNPLIRGIPEGDWFCSRCLVSSNSRQSVADEKKKECNCCLCPVKGGAMKPTMDGRWAHILCSLLVPEVFFGDPEGRDGIDCSRVPSRRWKEICYVCNSASGCAIECSEPKCSLAFHVTCGLKEELCIEYREGKNRGAVVAGFCKSHTELWNKQQQTGKFKIVAREEHTK
ncbi:hypothetical protein HHK36_005243 [Tetracentron sinense]|uniref:Protein Jade-1 n=1 Tax=Tetracentron sinense TaxID=13715 RepID=A0A834ZKG0_TETSI|nr:hypothetical protein HHK36_005243 [Tetracentron sinense]